MSRKYQFRLAMGLFVVIAVLAAGIPRSSAASSMAITISISPASSVIPVTSTKQFTAVVSGGATNKVTWSLVPPNGVAADKIGTISASGLYTAPATPLPNFAAVTVKAVSVDNPAVSAAASVTPRHQIPWVSAATPNSISFGAPFTLTITGSRFVSGAQVLWNGAPLPTSYVSSTKLTATGTAAKAGNISVTVANPGPGAVSSALTVAVVTTVTVSVAPTTATVQVGATKQFTATVGNAANQAVTWQVNGKTSGESGTGTISAAGLYTAPDAIPSAGIVTITALSQADNSTKASATVTITDPLMASYSRFLDQISFGPTPQSLAAARQAGMQAFLEDQFNKPESTWPALATAQRSDAIDAFFANAMNGQDQLRQRVLFALSEILVISMNKNTNGNEIVPWLQLLSRNAFGNYRTLLREITLDATMGKFLDLANSGVGSGAPNENYPREVMQLFSIGLFMLNPDGSQMLDANGNPIPTYSQTDVQQLARALTGWTYANANGTTGSGGNYNYYPGPMIPVPGKHNQTAKTILGQTIPSGLNAQQDLDASIDILFNHPNVGPFLATRLIRALVTSNPSPDYISRVSAAFANSNGVRGDMKAVIRAIIMDPEARDDAASGNVGRLRTPMQHTIAFARALSLPLGKASQFAYLLQYMNEGPLNAPSVFGHYSPSFRIPKGGGLFGPEFQIYSPSDAINRGNFFYSLIYNPWPINPALQPFVAVAGDAAALVNAVDNALLFGRMSASTRTAILNAIPAMPDNNQRVLAAVYLAAMSADHLVQR
ncbi:MAG: DUF1800 family protein [Blastocatellia bacterium]|nr:DUF1800 family protein [Blastocatellia bacterium]